MTTQPTQQVTLRLPTTLLDRLEAYIGRVRATSPGLGFNRAAAIRCLLFDRLDALEAAQEERATSAP
jgi:hypothetical protein